MMLAIISINGTAPAVQPKSDSFSCIKSDLLSGGSGRSAETGRAIRYLVRKNVRRLDLKFKGKSAEIAQVAELTGSFTQHVVFVLNGVQQEADMYPGDRQISDNGMTAELSVSLIEI